MSASARTFAVAAVAFDLDGTLLDTVHDLAAAVNRLLAEHAMAPLPKATVRDLVGKGMANLVGRAVALSRGAAPPADELGALLARYQAIYAEQLGRETTLFPGVVEGLDRLREAGLALGVVTNKASRFVAPHLERAGIAHYFAATVGGDDAPAKKPDAAPMRLVARRLGVAASRLLMVGDSGNDALAARAAGCPVVVVPYGYNEGLPVASLDVDGIVGSILELAGLVTRADDALVH
ncbi:MAG: phosphoglycolate phosphatase [Betaproteobacteria bacterium]|nr:phosphoglycolate phosphatase [Betaproteobacteria bacterium]MDH5288116.1 phosphoglycolate phosphatase [Betaproteobacteria bacterium]